MTKRTTRRLALAEYVSPSVGSSEAVGQARLYLMEIVHRVHFAMLQRLLAIVYPSFCEFADQRNCDHRVRFGHEPFKSLPKESRLRLELSRWAAEFNAHEGWLLDGALHTLNDWRIDPDWRQSLHWHASFGFAVQAVLTEPFDFRFRPWDVQIQSLQEYSSETLKQFRLELAAYQAKCREFAESQGLVRVQSKYSPDSLEWFVRYQFAGESSKEIADNWVEKHEAVDDSTVLKGIKAVAKLIQWSGLRPARRTRKRKIQ